MDLGGDWLAAASNEDLRREFASADLDESFWQTVSVPGHWRSHPAFADSDGPILYRRRFSTAGPRPGRRWFLIFDGIFYQGDVWLDGEYLGDTEGYFFPHAFEITAAVAARTDHLMAVEVACSRPPDLGAKRNLTGSLPALGLHRSGLEPRGDLATGPDRGNRPGPHSFTQGALPRRHRGRGHP